MPAAAGLGLDTHREIGLAPNVAKKLRKITRMRLAPRLEAAARPGQMCGIQHKGVDIASLHVQAFFQACRRYHRAGAALFADVKQAFYRLHRDVVLAVDGLEPGTPRADAVATSLLARIGVEPHLVALVSAYHCGTHFAVGLHPDRALFAVGLLPGDTLADMIFNIAALHALNGIEAAFQAGGILPYHFPEPRELWIATDAAAAPIVDVSHVDDDAFLIQGEPLAIPGLLCKAVVLLHGVLEPMGLAIHLGEGKTEAVVSLHGRGTRAATRGIFVDCAGALALPAPLAPAKLFIKRCYKHLGTLLGGDLSFDPEVTARVFPLPPLSLPSAGGRQFLTVPS